MVLLCGRWHAACVQRLQTRTLTQNLQIPIAEMNKRRRQEVCAIFDSDVYTVQTLINSKSEID